MSKDKNSDKEIGHNYCSCGEYLYSETEERIRVARGRKVTIYLKKKELEITCPHCNEIIKVKF